MSSGSGYGAFQGGLAETSNSGSVISTASGVVSLSSSINITISKDIIKIVQDVLNQKGYDCGTVDGDAGTKTKDAIKLYLNENADNDTDSMIISMVAEGLGIE